MAISGKFVADFADFNTAVQGAQTKLVSFETGASKVTSSLERMEQSLSGKKLIQDATLAVQAVENIGGVSKLTETELQKLASQATAATDKMRAMGIDIPPGLQKIADAATKVHPPLGLAEKAAGLLTSAFGQFTLAGLATTAITKLSAGVMEFADQGTRLPAIEAAFDRLNAGVGENSTEMLAALTTGTQGMVSNFDLMQSANKAMLLGLPVTTKSMGELAKTATVLGKAMGQDATKSLDDLIVALGRSSPMILDNLGLSVKVGEANEVYAQKLGKSADALTDAEKKTAFYNAAMEAARLKTQELGDQTKTLGELMTTVWTTGGNVVTEAAGTLNVGLGAILTSGKQFALFLKDLPALGLAGAVQMAALREKTGALKETLDETAPAVKATTTKAEEMASWIGSLRKAVEQLTPQQQTWIDQLTALNVSEADIAKRTDLSTSAIHTYTESIKTRAATVKAAIDDETKAQIAYADLESSLHREALKHQTEVATEQARVLKVHNQAVVDGNAEIKRLNDELHDYEMQASMDTSTYQIMKVWEKADAEIKAFKGTREQASTHADLMYTIASYEAKAITDVMNSAADAMAAKAQALLAAMAGTWAQYQAALDAASPDMFGTRVFDLGPGPSKGGTGRYVNGVDTWGAQTMGRALGGPVAGGAPYLVGERGPELFVPSGNGSILPSGGSVTNVTIHITQPFGTPDQIARAVLPSLAALAQRQGIRM